MQCTSSSLTLYFTLLFYILFDFTIALDDWQGAAIRWAKNCDFPGNNIANQIVGGDRCGTICQNTIADCTHFTFTLFQGGTCWFKSGPVLPSQAIPLDSPGSICGFLAISWTHEIDLAWSHHCTFPSGDFKHQPSEGALCGTTCMQHPECTHFVWTNIEGQGGICWLKSGGATKESAILTAGERGAVCGYRYDRPPNGSVPIVTTSAPWFATDTCECVC
ncbi:uncharacterized protein LOC130690054 [Daphnia carinata]|uniref:uncharacterized protein LOC130690054 n=1 Tax=Daphnia carinata TaxID=120202 RepID=UPI0025808657|nr:uncharacterized protein LOC130690054 [Daphnia carinata]